MKGTFGGDAVDFVGKSYWRLSQLNHYQVHVFMDR